jgi:hypothetical protein
MLDCLATQAHGLWVCIMQEACLKRAMSGRPDSGNALPLHLGDRHQHTSVYLFHPFSCPALTLAQLSDGERFLCSRRLQRDAQLLSPEARLTISLDRMIEAGLVAKGNTQDPRRIYYRLTALGQTTLRAETERLSRVALVARRQLGGA